MIKKFKLYIMLVAVALSSVSCLDKMPEDGIPFDESLQTVSDINLAVIGIYDAFRSKYLYSGNLTLLPDIQTDLVYGVNGNTNVYGDIWRWKEIKPTNTDIEAVYGALYDVINRCNFMLRPRGRRAEKDHRRQGPRQAGPVLRRGLLCPCTCLLGAGEALLQGIRKR